MRRSQFMLLVAALLVFSVSEPSAQTITISSDPAGANFYMISEAGVWTLLGTGSAKFKLNKKLTNRVWVVLEGYDTATTDFPTGKKYPKEVTIPLANRLVKVTALPYDAVIYANGERKGSQYASVGVPRGQTVTLEVRKAGFKTETRTYRHEPGREMPPTTERIELKDRLVVVNSAPDGAIIKVDGATLGHGTVDVVVPFDKCVSVVAELESYSPQQTRFCNKEGLPVPKTSETIPLKDRMVALTASPANAEIRVSDRVVGTGSYNVVIPRNGCTTVEITASSYGKKRRQYCDAADLIPTENIDLPFDEAYTSSIASDQANVNFTIEVGGGKTADQAWRTISQIVLSSFDVLEITDKETGYMRTAWEVTKFRNSIVRTRVIVKLGDSAPLKYVVKIASEHSNEDGVTVKDDEKFREWDRILNSYKDIINELQARLR